MISRGLPLGDLDRDARILFATRAARMFAYGFLAVVLVPGRHRVVVRAVRAGSAAMRCLVRFVVAGAHLASVTSGPHPTLRPCSRSC